jgi:cytochrome c oxidase assembly protein subunit 15
MDKLTRYAWTVLAANLGVILWGAYVRASGSGAGCGSHWPLCNGEVLPRAAPTATLIEFTHRATSGLALLAVVALVVWVFRARPQGHPARPAAVASLVLMLTEAAIGAGLVLFQLVADNASLARALFMATHLTNTFLLLAALTLTAHHAGGAPTPRWRSPSPRVWLLLGAAAALLLVGISGAVAALGDTLWPAASLDEALQQDLSPTAHVLIRLRILHPLLAALTSLGLLYLAAHLAADRSVPRGRAPARALALGCVVQVACGVLNVLLLAPTGLQLAHLLLADIVWIAFVLMASEYAAAANPAAARPSAARA